MINQAFDRVDLRTWPKDLLITILDNYDKFKRAADRDKLSSHFLDFVTTHPPDYVMGQLFGFCISACFDEELARICSAGGWKPGQRAIKAKETQ